MVSQRGVFSVHAAPDVDWNGSFDLGSFHGLGFRGKRLVRQARFFPLPHKFKSHFRSRLAGLGVDASSIMADLGGLCEALEWRYRGRL
jgi:hypothetical protein